MVVETMTLGTYPREPTISKEMARHKKRQKGPDGEVRSPGGSNLVGSGCLASFQDPEFQSDLFIDAYLNPLSIRRGLLGAGSLAAFHQIEH